MSGGFDPAINTMLKAKSTRLIVALIALSPWTAAAGGPVDFSRDIRPIFSKHCFSCHGPEAKTREAELRLDTEKGLRTERDGGHVVVPGDPSQSVLYQRITSTVPDERMPPADPSDALTPEPLQLIRAWIQQGAPWQRHWSFVASQR